MSPVYDDLFTPKEMLLRMETKIDALRQELLNAQASMVSKTELDIQMRNMERNVDRIESQFHGDLRDTRTLLDDKLREYRTDSQGDLAAFKGDINLSITRLIMALGFFLALMQFLVQMFLL